MGRCTVANESTVLPQAREAGARGVIPPACRRARSERAHHRKVVAQGRLGGPRFPRMTKDIDLLLPRNAANNKRLLKALEALRPVLALEHVPDGETLNAGFSTSAEGDQLRRPEDIPDRQRLSRLKGP